MAQALLVVDVQHELVEALALERRSAFLSTVSELIERGHRRGVEVVYVRHADEGLRAGTPSWEVASEVSPRQGEPIVEKHHGDAFEETDLGDVLASRGVDDIVVCGMQSDFCIDATARGAARRGYHVTVVEDGHATYAADGLSEEQICKKINDGLRDVGIDVVAAATVLTADIPQSAASKTF